MPKHKNGRSKRKATLHQKYLKWEEETWPRSKYVDSFPKFSKLPHELQVLIWEAAIPDPRVIRFELKTRVDRSFQRSKRLERSQPPPSMLFACHDSRDVARQVYSLAFSLSSYQPTWVDFRRDVLEFPLGTSTSLIELFPLEDARKIEQVIVHCGNYNFMGDLAKFSLGPNFNATGVLWQYLGSARLTNIRKLTLVVPGNAKKNVPWIDLDLLALLEQRVVTLNIGTPMRDVMRIPEITEKYDPTITDDPSTWIGCELWRPDELNHRIQLIRNFNMLEYYRGWIGTNAFRTVFNLRAIPESHRYLHREIFQPNGH